MAYFSNSTEGMEFEDSVCAGCLHHEKDEGAVCPVMGAHIAYQGTKEARGVLDMLISRNEKHEAVCHLFVEAPGGTPWD